ncbi:Uncharacterised protein [uncultured archaeon]|nr:Uncharacterised protein [uncultured archaeon]
MNIISSCAYPVEYAIEMDRLVDSGVFPSKNAIVREGIKRVLQEQSMNTKAQDQSKGAGVSQ